MGFGFKLRFGFGVQDLEVWFRVWVHGSGLGSRAQVQALGSISGLGFRVLDWALRSS